MNNNTNSNSWIANGGNITEHLYYAPYVRTNQTFEPLLTCLKNDAFTVKETDKGNGKLDYPVALLISDEIMLAGSAGSSNYTYYLYNQMWYWTLSPSDFKYNSASSFNVNTSGVLDRYYNNYEAGVRPAISLKVGMEIEDGDGTVNNPYVISGK